MVVAARAVMVRIDQAADGTWCRSEWQMPQKRISMATSRGVASRRGMLVVASGAVALAAE